MKTISLRAAALILLASAGASISQAQVSIGGRTGINFASFSWEEAITDVDDLRTSSIVGPHVGFVAVFEPSTWFGIQAEANYIQKGGKYIFDCENCAFQISETQQIAFSEYEEQSTIRAHYIEVPILARLRFGGENFGFNVLVGPSAGFAIAARSAYQAEGETLVQQGQQPQVLDESEEEKLFPGDDFIAFDLGLNAGAGVEIAAGPGKVIMDLRYQLGFSNLIIDADLDERRKNRGFQIGIGYIVPL